MLTPLATTSTPAICPICGRPSRITIRTQRDDSGPARTVITGPECAACMAALQPLADEAGRMRGLTNAQKVVVTRISQLGRT